MFSSLDKAIAAGIMALIYIVNSVWGVDWFDHITEEYVSVIIAVLTPLFVWLVPNRPPDEA